MSHFLDLSFKWIVISFHSKLVNSNLTMLKRNFNTKTLLLVLAQYLKAWLLHEKLWLQNSVICCWDFHPYEFHQNLNLEFFLPVLVFETSLYFFLNLNCALNSVPCCLWPLYYCKNIVWYFSLNIQILTLLIIFF